MPKKLFSNTSLITFGRILTADEHRVLRRDVRRRHFIGGVGCSILVQAEIATTSRASGTHPTVELAVTLPQSENGDGELHVAGEQRVVAPNVDGPERPGPRARVPAHVKRQGGGQQRVQHPTERVHCAAGRSRGAEQLVHHGRVFGVHADVLPAVRGRAPVNRRGRDEQQSHVRVPDHVDLKRAALVPSVRAQQFGRQYRAQVRVRRISGHCVHGR